MRCVENESRARTELKGRLLAELQFECGNQLAYFSVTKFFCRRPERSFGRRGVFGIAAQIKGWRSASCSPKRMITCQSEHPLQRPPADQRPGY
jgi:hypothetical protein